MTYTKISYIKEDFFIISLASICVQASNTHDTSHIKKAKLQDGHKLFQNPAGRKPHSHTQGFGLLYI